MDLTKTVLGIELGSTRIKAVLIDQQHRPIASGDYEWENRLVNGIWTYSMESVHTGLRACVKALKADLKEEFGVDLTTVSFSAAWPVMVLRQVRNSASCFPSLSKGR